MFTSNPSITIAGAAQKLKIPTSSLACIKLTKLGFKARVKKPAPKYVKDQENRAKIAFPKIYHSLSEKVAVIYDETYVIADPSEAPGKKHYHYRDPAQVNYAHEVKEKS